MIRSILVRRLDGSLRAVSVPNTSPSLTTLLEMIQQQEKIKLVQCMYRNNGSDDNGMLMLREFVPLLGGGNCNSTAGRNDLVMQQQIQTLQAEKDVAVMDAQEFKTQLMEIRNNHEAERKKLISKLQADFQEHLDREIELVDEEWDNYFKEYEMTRNTDLQNVVMQKETQMKEAIRAAKLSAIRGNSPTFNNNNNNRRGSNLNDLNGGRAAMPSVIDIVAKVLLSMGPPNTWHLRGDVISKIVEGSFREVVAHYFRHLDPPEDVRHGTLKELRRLERENQRSCDLGKIEIWRDQGPDSGAHDVVYYRIISLRPNTIKRLRSRQQM